MKTKITNGMLGVLPNNYNLTFSRSESNDKDCLKVLEFGGNVSVVFKDRLPVGATYV